MQGCTTATSEEELRERLGPTSDAAVVAAVQAKVDEARTKELARTAAAAKIDFKLLHAAYSACGVDSASYLGEWSPTLIDLLLPLCTKANSEEELIDVLKVSHLSFACGVGCSPFHGHQRPCSESCSSSSIRGHAVSVMQGCTTATSKEELRERLGPTSDAALVAAVQAKVEEKRTKELSKRRAKYLAAKKRGGGGDK